LSRIIKTNGKFFEVKLLSKDELNNMWNKFRLNGSQEALSLIYYDHFDFLYEYALRFTSDRNLVEDCIQNIFGKLLKKRNKLGPVSNLHYYLLQILRRELFDQLQKKKRMTFVGEIYDHFDQFCYNKIEDQINSEERERMVQLVYKIIAKLGPKQQEIIYLRFNQDLDYPEIAKILNISVDSCYKSIYRSIKFIKENIGKEVENNSDLFLWIIIGIKKLIFHVQKN
jgi:RNA polymerase sigma factor (sigma-70 family)